jgi:hypothetical protein
MCDTNKKTEEGADIQFKKWDTSISSKAKGVIDIIQRSGQPVLNIYEVLGSRNNRPDKGGRKNEIN